MSDLSPAQMRQITAAVYAVAPGRADRGRAFAGLRRRFAVASYRERRAGPTVEVEAAAKTRTGREACDHAGAAAHATCTRHDYSFRYHLRSFS